MWIGFSVPTWLHGFCLWNNFFIMFSSRLALIRSISHHSVVFICRARVWLPLARLQGNCWSSKMQLCSSWCYLKDSPEDSEKCQSRPTHSVQTILALAWYHSWMSWLCTQKIIIWRTLSSTFRRWSFTFYKWTFTGSRLVIGIAWSLRGSIWVDWSTDGGQ